MTIGCFDIYFGHIAFMTHQRDCVINRIKAEIGLTSSVKGTAVRPRVIMDNANGSGRLGDGTKRMHKAGSLARERAKDSLTQNVICQRSVDLMGRRISRFIISTFKRF
jgi:hypothetical protein